MNFNFRAVINILGTLLLLNGLFMLSCIIVALIYDESWSYITYATSVTMAVGVILRSIGRKSESQELNKKDGFLIVTLGWLILSFSGTLPYLFSGEIPNFTNAFFETISGYTTTGASILTDIESLPNSLLFWRSLTQWIGGMGIIVLAVAILPFLGIGGMQLFGAESPGISPDKMKPRIKDTAKRLWFIYLGLTLLESILLYTGGMTYFDAINHSLTTMATGGFSTKQASIGYWDSPFIHYVITFFMFLAGTNFTIIYFGIKGQFKKVRKNEEFKNYFLVIVLSALLIFVAVLSVNIYGTEQAFRESLFHVVSLITTTGFATADYTLWAPGLVVLFFILMFFGGSAGSTAGGIKIVRHTLLLKNSIMEIKRQLHPSAVLPVRINGKPVSQEITYNVLAFIMLYLTVFFTGLVLFSFTGEDFDTTIGAVVTTLGNIGPGFGKVGPANNFAEISDYGKWLCGGLMLLGRLELFTVLMLLSPSFWKKY